MNKLVIPLCLSFLASTPLLAVPISINPVLEQDAQVLADGTVDAANIATNDYQVRVGEFFNQGSIYVMPFLLPNLGAGMEFSTADLQIKLNGIAGTPANVDLYGLGVRSAPTVLASDFYIGATPDATDATLLQQGYLTPSLLITPNANVNTDAVGDAALVSYLNAQYAGGANAGKYVFLRLSYALDPVPQGNNAYNVLTEIAGGSTEKPILSFDSVAVPEPSTYALLAVSSLALMLLYRRRTQ